MLTNYTLNLGNMAADASGNTYIGGWQQGKGTLASADGQQLLLGVGRYNIDLGFVASYGPQGQLRWAQNIRNLDLRSVYVQDVVTGTGGQVYALGTMGVTKTIFSSSNGRADTIAFRSPDGSVFAPFLATYSSTGRLLAVHPTERSPHRLRAATDGSLYLLSQPSGYDSSLLQLTNLDSLGQAQWTVRTMGNAVETMDYRPAPAGSQGVWLLIPGQQRLTANYRLEPVPVALLHDRDTLLTVRPTELALVHLATDGHLVESKKLPLPTIFSQLSSANRALDLGFDELGRPLAILRLQASRMLVLDWLGQAFHLTAETSLTAAVDENGHLRWQQQLGAGLFNSAWVPTGGETVTSFPIGQPEGRALARAAGTPAAQLPPPYGTAPGEQWGSLDAAGHWRWLLPGGTTSYAYCRSVLQPIPGGSYAAASLSMVSSVVQADTLPAHALYTARLGTVPVGLPLTFVTLPAAPAAPGGLQLSYELPANDNGMERGFEVLRLYVTSPQTQPLLLNLRAPGGRVAFTHTYPLRAGRNVLAVDLGKTFDQLGYYELELFAAGKRCPAPKRRPFSKVSAKPSR